ncbi:MAG: M20/M25/M40 family metallo-hydrolase [Bacteroidetes bacterium]|nr:M20/M25/M40 family metallo-hydrolase [Bacteroidota bacterium]
MKKQLLTTIIFLLFLANVQAQKTDSAVLKTFFNEELSKGRCYEMLRELCNGGPRLSGSKQAENAVIWGKKTMEGLGFDRVFLQEVMVPHWIRGAKEELWIITGKGKRIQVPVCALGMSIGTGGKPLTAEIIEVKDFDELKALGEAKVKGKFVFFNRPMNPTHLSTFTAYGGAVNQRGSGASQASKYGGVGAIVRSMSLRLDDFPHTGAMRYVDSIKKVPAAAISTNMAEFLSKLLKEDAHLKIQLTLSADQLPDVLSHNVVGEIKGTEHPEEIIVIGGHLDSWDLGTGAHDDGAGVVQSIDALRLFVATGIKPKRTIRVVLFMNEENGRQRYFDFHHAKTDTFDGVNKRELEMGAAGLAGLLYLLSEYGF